MGCAKRISRGFHNGQEKISACLKTPIVHYKVVGNYFGASESRIFGFCKNCAPGMDKIHNWKRGFRDAGTIVNFYCNSVSRIEKVDPNGIGLEKVNQKVEYIKSDIKRILGFKKNMKIDRETWIRIFTESLDEFEIEKVMGS